LELSNDRLIARYARNAKAGERMEVDNLKKRIKELEEESKMKEEKITQLKAELKSKDLKLKHLCLISLLFPFSLSYYIFMFLVIT
jgi:multidrug resistance efflux pump